MLSAIIRLQRLWYLILTLSTCCLIADITFTGVGLGITDGVGMSLSLSPLVAEIPTIMIFAYGIWGKSQPFLLPTSSPSSNPCTRSCRHMGTCFLALLWIMTTFVNFFGGLPMRKFMAGIAILIMILILVEMVGSHRVGREQRRILKQEKRKLKQQKLREEEKKKNGSSSSDSNPSPHSGSSLGRLDMNSGEGLVGGSNSDVNNPSRRKLNDDDDDSDLESGGMVEIVRPDPVDKATVMLQQQHMYEHYQRLKQQQQQYQLYLMHQHLYVQGSGSGSGSGSGPTLTSESSESVAIHSEGKLDDIRQESSYKIEIDLNDPQVGPSSSSYPIDKRNYLYPPSAPLEVSFSSTDSKSAMVLAIAAEESSLAHQPTLPASSTTTASRKNPLHKDDEGCSSAGTQGSVAKSGLFSVEMKSLSDSNPISDEVYEHVQGHASAPPYEQESSSTDETHMSREPARFTLP
ncbi:hypothetical protein BG006_010533 [Podila minutissima]|uniref:Uncharacterized protein n=1 Tax=Podila minutissima TaxID=64525 RepID=A0A9P5SUT0_9FUNG|nr:hypothetical protein BG006_010533 [Podila minutissima]